MPFKNEHAARQTDPKKYVRFRRGKASGFPSGVEVIWGVTEDGKSEIQSIRFEAGKWPVEETKAWLKDHDFKTTIDAAKEDAIEQPKAEISTGSSVYRFDIAELRKPQRDMFGYLRGEAYLTRVGVLPYKRADGSIRMEFRPPDEVTHLDSMQSLSLIPLTLDHPPDLLSPANARDHMVGAVGEQVKHVDGKLKAGISITDQAAIAAVEGGTHRQVSCGYACDMDDTPGEWDGIKYDTIQRNIRYNHVALVPQGRAGPECSLRMDGADIASAVLDDGANLNPKKETETMIKLDGISYECPDQTAQAMGKVLEVKDEDLSKLQVRADELSAELDATKKRADEAEAKLDAAVAAADPTEIRKQLAPRLKLEAIANKHLDRDIDPSEADADIKREVVQKLDSNADLEGKSEAYIDVRFDLAVEAYEKGNPGLDEARKEADEAVVALKMDNVESARAEYINKLGNAWRRPVELEA